MNNRFEVEGVTLICGNALDLLPVRCNAVISDPPFGARTHAGHDAIEGDGRDNSKRVGLGYSHWTQREVFAVCGHLPQSGWVCIFSDHVLGREWEIGMKERGRYVFAPIPVVTPGRSVRLSGDGPSSWTDWLIVSRTKTQSNIWEGNH